MTTGIYLINFNNYEEVYVGQAVNISNRIIKHRSLLKHNKHYNYKMQEAYNKYGDLSYDILEVCSYTELTYKEDMWIREFDSLNNGINLRDSKFTANSGVNASRSKFSEEQLVEAFALMTGKEHYSFTRIEEITGVTREMLSGIYNSKTHIWLQEQFPEEWKYLQSTRVERTKARYSTGKYPTLVSPEGEEYSNITNLKEFARLHNLHYASLHKVCSSAYSEQSIHGWTVKK
jgi:group I intron endonuclease